MRPPTTDVLYPDVLSNGEIVWHTADGRLLGEDGSVYLEVGQGYSVDHVADLEYGFNYHYVSVSGPQIHYAIETTSDWRARRAFFSSDFVLAGVPTNFGNAPVFGNATVTASQLSNAPSTPSSAIYQL